MKMQLMLAVNRPPAEVYEVISDLERIPEWVKSAVDARCVSGTRRQPGARYQTVTKFLGRRLTETLELTEVEPGRAFAMKAVAGTFPHALAYHLEPAGDGTKVTVNVSAEPGRFFLLAGPLLEAVMGRQLATNLRDLKALIEAPAGEANAAVHDGAVQKQKQTSFVFARPHGFTRAMSKVPTWLYQRGWGWLLGHRMLMITHIGRKSGRVYDTVLDVIRYDPRTRESVVISAYGDRADWLRNIQAQPPLAVQVGRDKYVPTWRVLTPQENYREFPVYRRAHPLWVGVRMRWFAQVLGLPYERTPQAQRAIVERLCLVSFRPHEEVPTK